MKIFSWVLLLLCLIPMGTAMAADVLIGEFEAGQIITELRMQYKGCNDKALFLFDPLDTGSPDGLVVIPLATGVQNKGKFLYYRNDVLYVFIPGEGAMVVLYRRQ